MKKNKKFYAILLAVAIAAVVVVAVAAQGQFLKGGFFGRFKPLSVPASGVKPLSSFPVSGVKPLSVAKPGANENITRAQLAQLLVDAIAPNFVSGGPSGCFKDVKDLIVEQAVCYLVQKEVMSGYAGGNFGPANSVNRAEAAKLFNLVFLNLAPSPTKPIPQQYKDVLPDTWFYTSVNQDAVYGILDIKSGIGANFYPSYNLTVGRAKYWVENAKKNVSPSLWLK